MKTVIFICAIAWGDFVKGSVQETISSRSARQFQIQRELDSKKALDIKSCASQIRSRAIPQACWRLKMPPEQWRPACLLVASQNVDRVSLKRALEELSDGETECRSHLQRLLKRSEYQDQDFAASGPEIEMHPQDELPD